MNHNPYNKCMKKYLLSFLIILSGTILAEDTVANIFKVNYKNQLFFEKYHVLPCPGMNEHSIARADIILR